MTVVQTIPYSDRYALLCHKLSKQWNQPHPLELPENSAGVELKAA